MRNLNECQAEVFRRSEKRIKARKQRRNRIGMVCIPLALCITLCSALFLPGSLSKEVGESIKNESALGSLTADKSESFTDSIVKITVSGSEFSQTYADTSDVLAISEQLFSYEKREPETEDGIPNHSVVDESVNSSEGTEHIADGVTESENAGYTIALFTRAGQKTQYRLTGQTLKNLTTDEICDLTQKQANELKDLLGIPYQ